MNKYIFFPVFFLLSNCGIPGTENNPEIKFINDDLDAFKDFFDIDSCDDDSQDKNDIQESDDFQETADDFQEINDNDADFPPDTVQEIPPEIPPDFCKTDTECDDKNICTDDFCDLLSGCYHKPNAVKCSKDSCSLLLWSKPGFCADGSCKEGKTENCDDGNICTDDFCNASSGCSHADNLLSCKPAFCDGLKWHKASSCSSGICIEGSKEDCDDGNICTDDICKPDTGCSHINNNAVCAASYCSGITFIKAKQCSYGICPVKDETEYCNDSSMCTDDSCDKNTGCKYVNNNIKCASAVCEGLKLVAPKYCNEGKCSSGGEITDCDDKNPCTDDSCKTSGCIHTANNKICVSGYCTGLLWDKPHYCDNTACAESGKEDCDDKLPCTKDTCDPSNGCKYENKTGSCSDGIECTINDTCINGECIGDLSGCELPETFGPVARIDSLKFATSSEVESYCYDFNEDGKKDNAFSSLAPFINPELQNGAEIILLEFLYVENFSDDSSFALNVLEGIPSGNADEFFVAQSSYQPSGIPWTYFPGSTIKSSIFNGGPSNFKLPLPLANPNQKVLVSQTRISGKITSASSSNGVDVINGVLTGKILKDEMLAVLDAIELYCSITNPKPSACSYLDLLKMFFGSDSFYDLDNHTAASICLLYTGKKAKAVGLK
jgi:hypothetical protein